MKRSLQWVAALALIALGALWLLSPSGLAPTAEFAAPVQAPDRMKAVATPASSVTPSLRQASLDSGGNLGSEELQTMVRAAQAELPKKSELKPADDEAAHHVGPELIRAGQALGDLAEYLERRPEEFRAASVFYASCAGDEALVPATRAVCYAALSKNKERWAPGVAERISRVGPEIVDIAKNLSN